MKTKIIVLGLLALLSSAEAAQLSTLKKSSSKGDPESNQMKGYHSTRIDNGEDDDHSVLGPPRP